MRRIVWTVLALALACGNAPAKDLPTAAYHWQNAKVGGGGFAPGIVFSPLEREFAYLRTDMGGNENGRGLGETLAIDPNRTSILFFGSRHDGLWRSEDSGAHWLKVASGYRSLDGGKVGRESMTMSINGACASE